MIQRSNTKPVTAEDLARMRVDGACELVEGRIVRVSPTGKKHGNALGRSLVLIAHHVKQKNLGLVTSGEAGFLVRRRPDSVRAPDLAFISSETLARFDAAPGTYYPGAPDLALEVLSPNDSFEGIHDKIDEYLAAGAKAVWVLSPAKECAYVCEPDAAVRILAGKDVLAGGEALPGFKTKVSAFFSDPPRKRR